MKKRIGGKEVCPDNKASFTPKQNEQNNIFDAKIKRFMRKMWQPKSC